MKKVLFIALALALTGCFKQPLPLKVGNEWDLQDQSTGDITRFTIAKTLNIGCFGDTYDLFISKQNVGDYWQPGFASNLEFFLKYDQNGVLIAPATVTIDFNGNEQNSSNLHAGNDTDPLPYELNPPISTQGAFVTTEQSRYHSGAYLPCMKPGDAGVSLGYPAGIFRVTQAVKSIDALKYKGLANCFRYSEGNPQGEVWDSQGENNAEEWCFAINGIGLVQLTNIQYHYAGIDWSTGCKFTGVTDPHQLAGVDWSACTVPNPALVPTKISPMVLKLISYNLN